MEEEHAIRWELISTLFWVPMGENNERHDFTEKVFLENLKLYNATVIVL